MINKKYIIIFIIILTILNIFLVLKKDTSVIEKSKVIKVERKEFNIYLQQTVGSEEYNPSNNTTFPSQGYLLNIEKTMCYDYNGKETSYKPTQNLVNEIIDGSITIESSNTIYCNLYFDKDETPTITTFNVKGKTSNGTELNNGFTYQTDSLPFNIEYTDTESDVKQYCINETEDSDNCNWYPLTETNSYSLKDNKDGLKTMYIYLKDKANNISEVKQATITVDKTKPVINTFTLTGTPDTYQTLSNNVQYTHTRNIKYNAIITEDNIESYCVYENSGCSYIETTEKELTKKEYNLTENEGIKTLSIKVKDKAGNESVVDTNSTKTITLDLQNPIATISSKSVTTDSITVIVGNEGRDISGIIERQCKINDQNTWTNAEEDGSCTISSLDDGTKLKDGTAYTIESRVRDASGRYSQSPYPSISVTTEKKGITGKDLLNNPPEGLTETDCNGMKRFVGKCNAADGGCDGVVDNFICFGYNSESDCKSGIKNNEYIYRIIGITSNGEIKLIKNKALASTYQWHSNNTSEIIWSRSDLYKDINGSAFYNNLGDWQNKIKEHDWPLDNMPGDNGISANSACSRELSTGVIAEVGLQTLADYNYAYGGSDSNCYDNTDCSKSWMFIGNNGSDIVSTEWSMSVYGFPPNPWDMHYYAWWIDSYGKIRFDDSLGVLRAARPVFYLNPSVPIISGNGISTDPFIVGE